MVAVEKMIVTEQIEIAKNIFKLVLKGDLVAKVTAPGQFINVKVTESLDPILPRPISIADLNKENHKMAIIYRIEGRGTELLSHKKIGDEVTIIGPLGNGFPIQDMKSGQKALIVGGGIGTPPLLELSKQLALRGVEVTHVLGFQTKEAVILQQELSEYGKTYVATEDGTEGTKGFVTDVIDQYELEFDRLYTCGPTPMLKALEAKFPEKEVYLSLEERMACGIGACYACVKETCKKDDELGYRKICSDGPVFRAGEVVL